MKTDSSLKQLFNAIENNDKTTVIQLLQKNPTLLTITDEIDKHALHLASQAGFPDIVKLLLDKGVDPNVKDKRGFTPLHYVAFHGKKWKLGQAMTQFIDKHEELSPANRPLLSDKPQLEEQRNYLSTINLLLEKNANVDALAKGDITPLLLMIYFNHTLPREFLLLKGANVNYITASLEQLGYLLDSSIENMLILLSPYHVNALEVLAGIQTTAKSRWATLSKNERLAQKILKQTAICMIAIHQQAIPLIEEDSLIIQKIIEGKTNEFSDILKIYLDDETYLERRVIQHLDKASSDILEAFKTIVAERMAIQLWKAYDREEQLALLQCLYQSFHLPIEIIQDIVLNFFPPASIKEEYKKSGNLQEEIREIGLNKVLGSLTSWLIKHMNKLVLQKDSEYTRDKNETIPTFIATLCTSLSLHPSVEKNIEAKIAQIATMLGYSKEWKLKASNSEPTPKMRF